MATYILYYFNSTSRGELIRLLLIAAGQFNFTDNRIERTDWPAIKPTTPWSSLPYIEIDGRLLGQSQAIVRYIAQKHELGGFGAWQQSLVDSVVEACNDIFQGFGNVIYAEKSQKEKLQNKFRNETLPIVLSHMEKFIQKNGQNGFAIGNKLTTADLALFNVLDQLQADKKDGVQDVANRYPKIQEIIENVKTNNYIASYLSSRTQATSE